MRGSVFQKAEKLKSTGVRRLVVDVEEKIELWAVEVLCIKAQTSQKA